MRLAAAAHRFLTVYVDNVQSIRLLVFATIG